MRPGCRDHANAEPLTFKRLLLGDFLAPTPAFPRFPPPDLAARLRHHAQGRRRLLALGGVTRRRRGIPIPDGRYGPESVGPRGRVWPGCSSSSRARNPHDTSTSRTHSPARPSTSSLTVGSRSGGGARADRGPRDAGGGGANWTRPWISRRSAGHWSGLGQRQKCHVRRSSTVAIHDIRPRGRSACG